MKRLSLTLLTCLSFNSLSADIWDYKSQCKSFIYEMRQVSSLTNDDIEKILPESHEFTPIWQYHKGKMDAFDDILMWLEYDGGPWTSD